MFRNMKLAHTVFVMAFLIVSCGSDNDDDIIKQDLPEYKLILGGQDDLLSTGMSFPNTDPNAVSISKPFTVKGEDLTTDVTISISNHFQLSLNNTNFANTITIAANQSNNQTTVYVRYSPDETVKTDVDGVVNITNNQAENISFTVKGKTTLGNIINYLTFDKERLANGGGYKQHSRKTFTLHDDVTDIETIKMYVKLTCPDVGCDEWDVFANVKIKDQVSGEDYELARYITPYWNDNSQLDRGFEFDVTDFKSILTGEVELRIRTECWNARGYEVTIDFDYIKGTPDYPYYAIARVFNYDNGSAAGILYGIAHDKDLTREITIPENAESTHLRTFINGWGEANPSDANGRRCAEWCYRTHKIKINGADTFYHYLGPLNCESNPVNNQDPGNWKANRAGWCPGMEIPLRVDNFTTSMAGNSFNLEYELEDWVSDGTKDAFYPISTFVVVKSNTVINRPIVVD